jgi:[methyl-Co(III) methanol-specific corrinoid protein]:coenzyme M methyltransferase
MAALPDFSKSKAMNPKIRLLNVLRKLDTDRTPFICPGGMMNMTVTEIMEASQCTWPQAHTDPQMMAQLTLAASRLAGIENAGVPFCMTVEAEAMGAAIDIGSLESEPNVAVYPMEHITDFDRLKILDPNAGRAKVCVEAIRILHQEAPDIPVFANLTGPVSLATSLLEPLTFYRALVKNKSAAHDLMKLVVRNLSIFGSALIEAGADLVCIADPSASGELLGKNAFSEFALSYINELLVHFRKKYGIPSIVHICGKVQSLGAALSELNAECISVDAVVRLSKLKELAPSKIVMGNVNTYLMQNGHPDGVFKNGCRCLNAGADILAPACGMSTRTPIKNIQSLSRAVLNKE